ncbi:MAG: hypothetical protein DHS20C09_20120 [marine bacterium B5-7]|nr:MAG: hypothetical protein DHS20C09_20120 [marine bacterium B5-7]
MKDGITHKLEVVQDKVKIKVEPNFTLRGTLYPVEILDGVRAIEERYKQSILDIPVLSKAEVYAGKMCAALSRQHPRDLFDIQVLAESQEGLTDAMRQAFVVYVACAPRPIHELLQPNMIDLENVYRNEFQGMTMEDVSLASLYQAREWLVETLHGSLTDAEKQFLLSLKKGKPDYSLLPFEQLERFPALQWKLINIRKMDSNKHREMLNKLEVALS